jgi:WD40 repeat protein
MDSIRCGLVFGLLLLAAVSQVEAVDPPAKPDLSMRPLPVRALAYSPDGKILVAGIGRRADAGAVVAWDLEGRKVLWQRRGTAGFPSVSFAPDGTAVAITNWNKIALKLDPSTGRELGEVGSHAETVRACVYVPGTDFLATGSDGIVRLWNAKTGKVAKELKGGHPTEVSSLVASHEGKWLVSSGPDGARIWDVATGAELKGVFKQDQGLAHYGDTFVTPDRVMFADNSATLRVIELPSGKEVLRHGGGGSTAAYAPKLGLAAYCWHGESVALMDLTFRAPTEEEKKRIETLLKEFDHDSYEVRVAASKAMAGLGTVAEPMLRTTAADGASPEVRARARDARLAILETPLRTLKGHTGEVGPMAFSPDEGVLATGSDDGTVRLWDPRTGKELARLDMPEPGAKTAK